jgi:hypothetical protein
MKKTIAAISASVLGISGAVAAAAAPADASGPACTNVTGHTVSVNANAQDWYMDCVPQYGLGKAEFSITSTDPFPAGYNLVDGNQTVTSTVNTAAVASYFSTAPSNIEGSFEGLAAPTTTTPTSQSYQSTGTHMIFPITGVASLDPADLPAGASGCFPVGTETYAHAYTVTFAPVTSTFTETIDGKVWTATITATPSPLILGLNFVAAPGAGFDTAAAQCVSSGGTSEVAHTSADPGWTTITKDDATLDSFTNNTLDPSVGGGVINLGAFATSDPAVRPTLATTGVNPAPGGLLGGGLLALGILLVTSRFAPLFRRRRSPARRG